MESFKTGRVPPIEFGVGRMAVVPEIVSQWGGGPVLVVADAALVGLGITGELARGLQAAGIACEMAAEVNGEPKESLIDTLTARARMVGAKSVIGIGGGASMDAAKLVAAIAPSGKPAHIYALGATPLSPDGLPAIAIPTTAGTGSEVTRTSVVSTDAGAKNWYWDERLMFAHAVLDPILTVSLPAHLTAWTGIDAVAHALEAVTARSSNAAGRLFGLEALAVLSRALPQAVADGANIRARGEVLWGSMVAGLALHNCNTHMGHNISHALGSLARIHHGLATGLALEVTLPWLVSRPEGADHYAMAARALGGTSPAGGLPDVFEAIMRSCEIPKQLPHACANIGSDALACAMKSPANRSMSLNAACQVEEHDLDDIAAMIMALPVAEAAW